jgi:Flp pilus assembly pilin Flp
MKRLGTIFVQLGLKLHELRSSEAGQDLVEYSLLVALIALGCIAGVRHVATAVSTVFSNVSSSLA